MLVGALLGHLKLVCERYRYDETLSGVDDLRKAVPPSRTGFGNLLSRGDLLMWPNCQVQHA